MSSQPPNQHPHRQPQPHHPQYPPQPPYPGQYPQYPQYPPPPMPPQQNWNPTQVQYELRHPARQAFFTSIGTQLGSFVGKHWFWLLFPLLVAACAVMGLVASALQAAGR
jgi:hypothetical protein